MKNIGHLLLGITAATALAVSVYQSAALVPEPVPVTVSYPRAPVSASSFDPSRININVASAAALDMLPGIGPVLAERIIAYREENGDFLVPEDLLNIEGIGQSTLEDLREYIIVE